MQKKKLHIKGTKCMLVHVVVCCKSQAELENKEDANLSRLLYVVSC